MTDARRTLSAACSGTALEPQWRALRAHSARTTRGQHTFERARYSPAAIARLGALWRVRMESEHRSTAVFAGLATQLMAARAPLDVQAAALSGGHDELAHAELCAEVLSALGQPACCDALVEPPSLPLHRGTTPEIRVLRNMLFGSCISEVVNAARFGDALEVVTDPYLRDVTRVILSDEIAHGQLGFQYLSAVRPWLDAHPDARADVSEYLRLALATYERDTFAILDRIPTPSDEERALGMTDPARDRLIFTETIEKAVVPALEGFGFEAERAWITRSLDVPGARTEVIR